MLASTTETESHHLTLPCVGFGLSWALLAIVLFTGWEPPSGASPGVLSILALSCVTAALSVLVPRGMRRAKIAAMPLETCEEPNPWALEGGYRKPPPARRRCVDQAALRAAAVTVAREGLREGIVLAVCVAAWGLPLKVAGGHPALVLMLFVESWALLASHTPAPTTALRGTIDLAMILAAVAAVAAVGICCACKAESDRADDFAARASSTIATIDALHEELVTDYWDQSGFPQFHEEYSVDYHLTVGGARYTGSSPGGIRVGSTTAVLFDPTDPSRNMLQCEQADRASRRGQPVLLLLACTCASLLILGGFWRNRMMLASSTTT